MTSPLDLKSPVLPELSNSEHLGLVGLLADACDELGDKLLVDVLQKN